MQLGKFVLEFISFIAIGFKTGSTIEHGVQHKISCTFRDVTIQSFVAIYNIQTENAGRVTRAVQMTKTTDLSLYGLDMENRTSILFSVKAPANIAIFATDTYNSPNAVNAYSLYIGGSKNTKCNIGDIRNGIFKVRQNIEGQYANETYEKPFWLSWENGEIQAGEGDIIGQQTFLSWSDPDPIDVHGIGIGTAFRATGEWQVKVDVKDKSAGFFNNCQTSNTRSELLIIGNYSATIMSCASTCAYKDICFGFNYHLTSNRCELMSYGDEPVSSITRHNLTGWEFYAKCYDRTTLCVGCFL